MTYAHVHGIWDALVAFRPGQIEEAVQFLMMRLCELSGAEHAAWTGALKRADAGHADTLGGWRSIPVRVALHGAPDLCDPTLGLCAPEVPDPLTLGLIRDAGQFRARRLCELVESGWLERAYAQLDDPSEAVDGVLVATPVRAGTESWFVFTRRPERGRFSELERDVLGNALRGLLWFQRRLLLWHGLLPGQSLLTAAERRVLAHALDGATDKEVASRLEAGVHTTREHMATLYRKFGVSSRAELLALWLGGNP